MKKSMDCQEFQLNIPKFLDDQLTGRELKLFLEHMNSCPECKEELCIQYLVTEGTLRLEDGDSFDLNKELDLKIENSLQSIKIQRRWNTILYVLELIGIAAVCFILVLVFTR